MSMGPKSKHEPHLFYIHSKIILHSICGLHSFEVRSEVFRVWRQHPAGLRKIWNIRIFRLRMLGLCCVTCVSPGQSHAIAVGNVHENLMCH